MCLHKSNSAVTTKTEMKTAEHTGSLWGKQGEAMPAAPHASPQVTPCGQDSYVTRLGQAGQSDGLRGPGEEGYRLTAVKSSDHSKGLHWFQLLLRILTDTWSTQEHDLIKILPTCLLTAGGTKGDVTNLAKRKA